MARNIPIVADIRSLAFCKCVVFGRFSCELQVTQAPFYYNNTCMNYTLEPVDTGENPEGLPSFPCEANIPIVKATPPINATPPATDPAMM